MAHPAIKSIKFYPANKGIQDAGLQCPECFGVRITTRRDRGSDQVRGWQCEECGCNWSPKRTH